MTESAAPRASRWSKRLLPLVPWAPGAAAIFLKFKLIGPDLDGIGGRIAPGGSPLSAAAGIAAWLECLSYFRGDLLAGLIVIPGMLLVLTKVLPQGLRAWPSALLASATVAVVYIQR